MSVVRVKNSDQHTGPLETFIKGLLGVTDEQSIVAIYMYGEQAYITAEPLIPILGVQLSWFEKNAVNPTHYIKIKRKVFINKYGLTILIAHSKEQVAFTLQDYIYETIYKLEKNGSVQISDVHSRADLLNCMEELAIYRKKEDCSIALLANQTQELKQMATDYYLVKEEYNGLRDQYAELEYQHGQLQKSFDKLKDISAKLAKCVKKTGGKNESAADELEVSSDDSDVDTFGSALLAKHKLQRLVTKKPRKTKVKQAAAHDVTDYHLMYGYKTADFKYRWLITSSLPEKADFTFRNQSFTSFKEFSRELSMSGIYQDEYDFIWYSDIKLSTADMKKINKIFTIVDYITESDVQRLIEAFTVG